MAVTTPKHFVSSLWQQMTEFVAGHCMSIAPKGVDIKDIETVAFFNENRKRPEFPDYFVCYIKNAGCQTRSELMILNLSEDIQTIDCGVVKIEMGAGATFRLTPFLRDRYEAKMRLDGVQMPWLRTLNMKARYCNECKKVGKLRKCSRCKCVRYCSRKCQKTSWNCRHRYDCKPI